ncbi:acetylxylan esterase [Arthrobacter sp. efr-133-TYG-104]|uniref:acetylxylan esterase n=1 Tax=Arthrobacter sp. efr-133-TYG-104 TaxID=3040324 RepID=UPI003305C54B
MGVGTKASLPSPFVRKRSALPRPTAIGTPATYIYRGIYAGAIRCFDVVSQHPAVNPERLGVRGVSQGGAPRPCCSPTRRGPGGRNRMSISGRC